MSSGARSYPTPTSPSKPRLTSPSTPNLNRDRPSSRSSIRSTGSNRAPSPALSSGDPVAVRSQQAQLQTLENMLLRGPRPYPPELSDPVSPSPAPSPMSVKVSRRSSYDVLAGIAGADSNLPLPRREPAPLEDFKEGVPMSFPNGGSPVSPAYKRSGSPTRTLSRAYFYLLSIDTDNPLSPSSPSLQPASLQPPSPNLSSRRISLTPGNTTKVLADLQTGVSNARTALENTKAQLRVSQRSVAQLTRQTEDLKEGRERLRLENEGLNNVVARKERLLQEVLERARKAEAEAAALKTQLKSETSTSKKAVREMEAALAESTALSQKSEREYITLRDSIKGLVEGFKGDADRLRAEMTKREAKWRGEAEGAGRKYRVLLEEIASAGEGRAEVKEAREKEKEAQRKLEEGWVEEIRRLKEEVERSNAESEAAGDTARQLAAELARLRRLMQNVRRLPSDEDGPEDEAPPP
ncbi:hypothetical protein B0H14DRAFT_2708232 [Mycena olivaceomarginata]|nr:hypothetical protein B0H14DRAFT_2708232 [Mycena olivaceomarginata]